MFGYCLLTGVRPRILQAQVECSRSSFERLEAHRTADIGNAGQPLGAEKCKPAHSVHGLRAIQQGQTLFCLQPLRLEPGATKCFATVESFTLKKRLSFSNQAQG